MHCLVVQSTDAVLDDFLTKCQDKKNKLVSLDFPSLYLVLNTRIYFSGLLLQSLLSSYKPHFIAIRGNKFVHILSNSNHDGVTRGQLFRLLGLSLCKQSPPDDQHLSVLNGAWKTITTLTQASEFIHCIEPWAEFASTNFGVSKKNRNFLKTYFFDLLVKFIFLTFE